MEVEVREVDGTWCRWISLGLFLLLSRERSPGGLFLFSFLVFSPALVGWYASLAFYCCSVRCVHHAADIGVGGELFGLVRKRRGALFSVLLRGSEDTITGFMVDFKMNFITSWKTADGDLLVTSFSLYNSVASAVTKFGTIGGDCTNTAERLTPGLLTFLTIYLHAKTQPTHPPPPPTPQTLPPPLPPQQRSSKPSPKAPSYAPSPAQARRANATRSPRTAPARCPARR